MAQPPPQSDRELFHQAIDGTEPLTTEVAEPYRLRPPPRPIQQPVRLCEDPDELPVSEAEIDCPDYLEFVRPGLQHRVLAELRRGGLPVELEVDLHGLTIAHARIALLQFLEECQFRRVRCACIIHGKGSRSVDGRAVLKCQVNLWLRRRREVLAFCSATRRDGGGGAVYVLLRNPDKQRRR